MGIYVDGCDWVDGGKTDTHSYRIPTLTLHELPLPRYDQFFEKYPTHFLQKTTILTKTAAIVFRKQYVRVTLVLIE